MKKFFQIVGIIFIVIVVLGGIGNLMDRSKSSKNVTSEPTLTQTQKDSIVVADKYKEIEARKGQTISAVDLVQTYQDNEVRADENYKGKRFYVEGIVGDIKKDIMDNIYVTLQGSKMFREVQCYFDDKATASRLEKGMEVTFLGECDGLMINVMMKNCKFVENLKDLKKSKK